MTQTKAPTLPAIQKRARLRLLVEKRREPGAGTPATGYSKTYKKLGEFHDGQYDCDDWVVPWSITASNVDSQIMLIAQDWASEEFLNRPFDRLQARQGYHEGLPTNRRLFSLLKEYTSRNFSEVFATDVFPFAKSGGMTARLPRRDLVISAEQYALPQIEIVLPKLVICIGSATYNAVRGALGKAYVSIRSSLNEAPLTVCDSKVVAVTHTGGLGFATAGGFVGVEPQWSRIRHLLETNF